MTYHGLSVQGSDLGLTLVGSTIRRIGRSKMLRFVVPIYTKTRIVKENGDERNCLNDAKAKRKVDLQIRDEFCQKLEKQAQSMNDTGNNNQTE